jgi:hypothetical protein
MASGVECGRLCTTTQEFATASAAICAANGMGGGCLCHKSVHIPGRELWGWGEAAATSMLKVQFDLVRSTTDDLAQFFTLKKDVAWSCLTWVIG